MKKNNVSLPPGFAVMDKPKNIELSNKTRSKWLGVVETLRNLDSTKTIQFSIAGLDKDKILSLKISLRHAAKKMKLNKKVIFGIDDDIMHIWVN